MAHIPHIGRIGSLRRKLSPRLRHLSGDGGQSPYQINGSDKYQAAPRASRVDLATPCASNKLPAAMRKISKPQPGQPFGKMEKSRYTKKNKLAREDYAQSKSGPGACAGAIRMKKIEGL
jgi:hypothetical protein